ncbi:RagB/SusD family nutrient uptake outer membrane protein [Chitinophaga silvatica]|nr:RagB/SusD family nutrient uptake outer membrane protein [Chitinophaga silvatica]
MKKLKYILPLLAVIGITACQKDLLSALPTTDIPDTKAFDTPDRIASQAAGLYSVLKHGKFMGGKVLIANEVRGEDYTNERSNNVTLFATWKMVATGESQEVKEIWSQGYKTINSVNVFLAGMNAKGTSVAGKEASDSYIGEAKFIRGLSYFQLLQLYARPYINGAGNQPGLILYWEPHTVAGVYTRARSTVAESYSQIIRDLDSSETLLPKEAATATRANAFSAIALKTRVYLYMGMWDKVITEANKLVPATAPFESDAGYQLESNLRTVFSGKYTGEEAIFTLPNSEATNDFPGTQTQMAYYFNPAPLGGNREYNLRPEGIIGDAFWKATDTRRKLITTASGKNYMNKYISPDPYTDYIQVIRYAEILLNLAEARVRSTNALDPQAIALLNAVHGRSDATTIFTAASFDSPQDLINTILKEKHIELLGEGFRAMELTRLGLTIPTKSSIIPPTTPTTNNYVWPISSDELVYNKGCKDNY